MASSKVKKPLKALALLLSPVVIFGAGMYTEHTYRPVGMCSDYQRLRSLGSSLESDPRHEPAQLERVHATMSPGRTLFEGRFETSVRQKDGDYVFTATAPDGAVYQVGMYDTPAPDDLQSLDTAVILRRIDPACVVSE